MRQPRNLDRSRPFGTNYPPSLAEGHYLQDGLKFDGNGVEILPEGEAPAPARKAAAVRPAPAAAASGTAPAAATGVTAATWSPDAKHADLQAEITRRGGPKFRSKADAVEWLEADDAKRASEAAAASTSDEDTFQD